MSRRKSRTKQRAAESSTPVDPGAAPSREHHELAPPRRRLWFLLLSVGLLAAWIMFLTLIALHS